MASTPTPIAGPSDSSSLLLKFAVGSSNNSPGLTQILGKSRRLPQAARNALYNYFDLVCEDPDEDERSVLLDQINEIPGGEWYTASHLRQWFIGRNARCKSDARNRKRKAEEDEAEPAKVVLSTDQILWPSLTASKIEMLSTLLHETPEPTETHLQVWSRTLNVDMRHLENWVQLKQTQFKRPKLHLRELDAELDTNTLPTPEGTPEGTASPQLQSPGIFTFPMSPLLTSKSLYSQTYANNGVPNKWGFDGTEPYVSQATAAFRPATAVCHNFPHTPTSPSTQSSFPPPAPPSPQLQHNSTTVPSVKASSPASAAEVPLQLPSPLLSLEAPSAEREDWLASCMSPPIFPLSSTENSEQLRDSSPVNCDPQKDQEPPDILPSLEFEPEKKASPPIPTLTPVVSSPSSVTEPPPTLKPALPPKLTLNQLCSAIQAKLAESKLKPPSPPPATFLELSQRLDAAVLFHDALERGEYASMGLVPSKLFRVENNDDDD
ncbi:hypothetical protein BC835DRAFT_1373219 [Cytidiella melzeri]|nr:hypothetical protein BC835DRAFT_1373219 [Cytidiella melzeri]